MRRNGCGPIFRAWGRADSQGRELSGVLVVISKPRAWSKCQHAPAPASARTDMRKKSIKTTRNQKSHLRSIRHRLASQPRMVIFSVGRISMHADQHFRRYTLHQQFGSNLVQDQRKGSLACISRSCASTNSLRRTVTLPSTQLRRLLLIKAARPIRKNHHPLAAHQQVLVGVLRQETYMYLLSHPMATCVPCSQELQNLFSRTPPLLAGGGLPRSILSTFIDGADTRRRPPQRLFPSFTVCKLLACRDPQHD